MDGADGNALAAQLRERGGQRRVDVAVAALQRVGGAVRPALRQPLRPRGAHRRERSGRVDVQDDGALRLLEDEQQQREDAVAAADVERDLGRARRGHALLALEEQRLDLLEERERLRERQSDRSSSAAERWRDAHLHQLFRAGLGARGAAVRRPQPVGQALLLAWRGHPTPPQERCPNTQRDAGAPCCRPAQRAAPPPTGAAYCSGTRGPPAISQNPAEQGSFLGTAVLSSAVSSLLGSSLQPSDEIRPSAVSANAPLGDVNAVLLPSGWRMPRCPKVGKP